jgi:hypothetical protein
VIATTNGKKIKLPDFLIAGAAKSGTTSLYHYLKQHPRIFMPDNKEPWFFSFAETYKNHTNAFNKKQNIVTEFDDYLHLFKNAKDSQISGEASTCYLYLYEETIKNIKKYHPNYAKLKIVILLRNPIERTYSHYSNNLADGTFTMSFEEVIHKWKTKQLPEFFNIIDYGFYYNQIKKYKITFEQLRVYLFDDLKSNSTQIIEDLYDFLGIEKSFIPNTDLKYNTSITKNKLLNSLIYKPNLTKQTIKMFFPLQVRIWIKNNILENVLPKPRLNDAQRQILREIYKEDILKLQDLIQKDLSHWIR